MKWTSAALSAALFLAPPSSLFSGIGIFPCRADMAPNPNPHEVDGTDVYLVGHPGKAHEETDKGYTVVEGPRGLAYARRNRKGELEASECLVNDKGNKCSADKKGWEKHLEESDDVRRGKYAKFLEDRGKNDMPPVIKRAKEENKLERGNGGNKDDGRRLRAQNRRRTETVTLKNLVVPFKFRDHAERDRWVPSAADLELTMNAPGGDAVLAPTGSVGDVFLENSYGQLSVDSVVADWVTVPQTESEASGGDSALGTYFHPALASALDLVDE